VKNFRKRGRVRERKVDLGRGRKKRENKGGRDIRKEGRQRYITKER
jgi:hypothetical protein